MSASPIASSEKIQTALDNLGIPNGFIAYDTVPLLRQLVVALGNVTTGGGGGSAAWGSITGTLSNQTDLQSALNAKLTASNNLSDLTNAATARTNLGVTATGADTTYAYRANNLSDLANAGTARTNLGLGSIATQSASNVAITGGSISGLTTLSLPGSVSGTTTLAAPAIAGTTTITFPSVTGTLAITGNTVSQFAAGGALSSLTGFSLRSTGAAFDLSLATAEAITANRTLSFNVGDANRTLTIPATGTVALLGTAQSFTAAQTISVNGAASTPPLSLTGTIFTGGSATTTKPAFLVEPSGTTSTGWSTSGTGIGVNLASGFTGNLLDLQKNGVRVFGVSDDGTTTACTGRSGTRFVLYDYYLVLGVNGVDRFQVSNSAYCGLTNGTSLAWAAATTPSLYLHRDADATLAQRNGTNAQTSRLYGTYTDASNYRRLAISSTTGGTFSIAPEGAGTGASGNVLHISGLPTSNPGPGILWNNAGTPAIGT